MPIRGEVGPALFSQVRQLLESLEVVVIDIGVHRAYDNRPVRADAPYIMQVGRGQGDSRKVSRRQGSTQTPTESPSWLWMADTWVLLVAMVTLASLSTSVIWR